VTGTIVISLANISSTCAIQCNGTIDYTRQTFDLNHDEKVDIVDAAIVARAFGSCRRLERGGASLDLNHDGQINECDLSTLASNCRRK
jgi:hypothetical protein